MTRYLTAITLSALLLAGCASQDEAIDNQTDQDSMADQMGDGSPTPIAGTEAETSAFQEETLTAQQMLEEADSPLASRVIYFEYDSAKVNDESLALLEAHGNFISGNGNVFVRLEGHADERGSREYNIALGDRRAQSVRRILLFQGSSTDQVDTISYGEEQPAALGHDESAWSQNRRVELVYEVR
ncbi:MAG: peptidoglycan-associated lipoprotein Pal [Gammaproteobacteria bacterium]|nr:peptidoglycan-associated lipoprotein Pal [Gammaproteobacteria bacterium]